MEETSHREGQGTSSGREGAEVMSEASGHKASISAGHTSRQKTVFIEGDADEICARLMKT